MNSVNRVMILGTLGHTPLLKKTKNGRPFCKMSLATENWENEAKKTCWHCIQVFGRQAELATEFLEKGGQVFVEGKIQNVQFEVQGNTQWRSWITAEKLTFLRSKTSSALPAQSAEAPLDGNSVPAESN